MLRLDENGFAEALARYISCPFFFPLIGAVLSKSQDGEAYCDDAQAPRQFYVQHRSGFAQMFGPSNPAFEAKLARRLLIERDSGVAKVRLYAPVAAAAIDALDTSAFRSQRQRFRLAQVSRCGGHGGVPEIELRLAGPQDVEQLETAFGIVTRFWRSSEDFLEGARAVVALDGATIASVCCAAAIAGERAEIDVATIPTYRGKAYGRMVVAAFIQRCLDAGVEPLWDCFTNNLPSMRTATASGFVPLGPPYLFLTIPSRSG